MEISENVAVNDNILIASAKQLSPWGKIVSVAPCSLASVMDEEIAKELQAEEDHMAAYHMQPAAVSSQETFEGIKR